MEFQNSFIFVSAMGIFRLILSTVIKLYFIPSTYKSQVSSLLYVDRITKYIVLSLIYTTTGCKDVIYLSTVLCDEPSGFDCVFCDHSGKQIEHSQIV
jgi:hypothetical protein